MSALSADTCQAQITAAQTLTGASVRPALLPDPRTVLATVAVVNSVTLGHGSFNGVLAAGLLTAVMLLALPGRTRAAIIFSLTFVLLAASYLVLPKLASSNVVVILAAIGFWFARFAVCIGLGIYAVGAIRPTELTAALRAIRAPRWVVIPLAVMLRVFPVIRTEAWAIGDAMTLRGVRPGFGSMFAHPIRAGEMLIVPLLSTVVRASDELAASAMLRGLGGPAKPTTISVLRFRPLDAALLLLAGVIAYLALATGTSA